MKRKKTWLILSSVLLMMLGVFTFSSKLTSAYFTDEEQVSNSVQIGKIETNIEESVDGLLKQHIGVSNNGNIPVFVRMMVAIPDNIDGVQYYIGQRHEDMWIKQGDYWYYQKALEKGDSTVYLYDFIKYTIDPKASVNPQQLSIIVYAESIQADNLYDENGKAVTTSEAAFELLKTQTN